MKVVIIDDDKLVSMSLKTILESGTKITVAAVGNDGTEALGLYERHRPDVLLMDIRMEHMTGVEAARKVIAKYSEAKILFLTTFSDDEYIIPALEAVQQGQTVFGGKIVDKLPGLLQESLSFDYAAKGITQKEYDIIQLVAQGLSNKEIAAKTFLSEGTIRNYLSTVLEKLDLRDRTQLAVFYYQNGGR